MVAIQFSAIFIQIFLSLVSAAPITDEIASGMARRNVDVLFQRREVEELNADLAAPLDNSLDIKQNLCHKGTECGGNCCHECGGCPDQNTCECHLPCPCDICSELKKTAKAALCPPPCPCELLNKPCCCEKVKTNHCNECGQKECFCEKSKTSHCKDCGKKECCCPKVPCPCGIVPCPCDVAAKLPCPCDLAKCICDKKPACHKCGEKECCC